MASYNWDHQEVILRVVSSLQDRGYLVWVDTEQMKGATVDTMALAVEGSEVVMIGVSRAYKESSNCRMEAQYALQKKKALIPLMLTQGYEADGWLGLLLGTSMWYGFYGETLSSESAFVTRMDALCREIGVRGRADAAGGAGVSSGEVSVHVDAELVGDDDASSPSADGDETLRAELNDLRLKQLRECATVEGLDEDAVAEALDADNPKAALIGLLLEHMASKGPAEQMLTALLGGGEACAELISSVLDHTMDVLEHVSASSPRKTRRSLRDVSDRAESVMESTDVDWCDGVLLVGIGDDHDRYPSEAHQQCSCSCCKMRCVRLEMLLQPLQHGVHCLTTQHLASLVATNQRHSCTRSVRSHRAAAIRKVVQYGILQCISHT
eukprot:COSAG06_NODE_6331_length_2978_cov_343.444290_2_plen_382_part_00